MSILERSCLGVEKSYVGNIKIILVIEHY